MSLQRFLKDKKESHSLPILHIPIPLRQLRPEVDEMAPKQQIVLRRNGQSVAHECPRVDDQSARHAARYAMSLQPIHLVYRTEGVAGDY